MTKVPPLAERQAPGLSRTLRYQRHPDICQGCGEHRGDLPLERWRECDAWDKPTRRVVVLCAGCSKREIKRHPRLYLQIQSNEPALGSMDICVDCTWRRGCDCANPTAKVNSGPGMLITAPKPIMAFLCPGGLRALWRPGVVECAGRATLPPVITETPGGDPAQPDTKAPAP